MNNLFSISQAAKMVNMTSETLRHYDRIGLVTPSYKDGTSQYRYYSEQELIQLQTIGLLRCMDLSLTEIKDVLQSDDLPKIIALFKQAEKNADEKISHLQYAKSKIKLAYTDYENKLNNISCPSGDEPLFVKHIPSRAILISENMEYPTLKNLWNYHSHFYKQVEESLKSEFLFEDMAGMITRQGKARLFAVCLKYPGLAGLTLLPEGDYLCGSCVEKNKDMVMENLLEKAKSDYGIIPEFTIHKVVVTGILQWSYEIQLFLGK